MADLTSDESASLVARIHQEGSSWNLPGTPTIRAGRRKRSNGMYHVWMVLEYAEGVQWSLPSCETTLALAQIAEESWITSAGGSLVRYRIGKLF